MQNCHAWFLIEIQNMGCTQNKSLYLVMGLENKKLAHFMEGN